VNELETTIAERLHDLDPEVELILLEKPAAESLRIYVDHPGGVDLGLCERVTEALSDLTAEYSLEVSSPGSDRPLTKPEHYRRYLGRSARVRTAEPIAGRRNFTGMLTEAGDDEIGLEADGQAFRIPLAEIDRSNLVPNPPEVASI
jgi:ribosome maturation factor RimP